MVQQVQLVNQSLPQMGLFRSKLIILNNNNHGYFMDTLSGMKKHIVFRFEKYPSN